MGLFKKLGGVIKNSESLVSSQLNKVKKYAEQTISKSYLTGCSWIITNNYDSNNCILYTFRNNGELLITINGIVEKATFELIIDSNSILITKKDITEHFNIINSYDDFIFLNKISTNAILILANQTKFKDYIKSEINQVASKFEEFRSFEKQKYTTSPNLDDQLFFTCSHNVWNEKNKNKTVFDYIDYLENKAKNEGFFYDKWKIHNPGKNKLQFGEFLVSKQIH